MLLIASPYSSSEKKNKTTNNNHQAAKLSTPSLRNVSACTLKPFQKSHKTFQGLPSKVSFVVLWTD